MYPELEHFLHVRQRYENKLALLEEKKQMLEQKRARLRDEYMELLDKRNGGTELEKLNERKRKIDRLTEKLAHLLERMSALEKEKRQRLTKLFPFVAQGREREIKAVEKHFLKKKRELLRFHAEYLLLVQQVHDMNRYRKDIDEAYGKAARMIHKKEILSPPKDDDMIRMISSYMDDVQQVYETGQLPDWANDIIGENRPLSRSKM